MTRKQEGKLMEVILRTKEERDALADWTGLPARMMDAVQDEIYNAESKNEEVAEIRLTRREARKLAQEAYRAHIHGVTESMYRDGIIPEGTYFSGVRIVNQDEVSE